MKYKIIILVGVGLILLIGIFAFIFGQKGGGTETLSGTVEVWGFEAPSVWREVIDAFENQNPKVDISYSQKNLRTYEDELINSLASGRGPDVFFIHHTWLQKHADKIAPFPESIVGKQIFISTFVDVATKDLLRDNVVWAMPLYVDTLALYYNKNIFNSSGVALPPKTWEEFNNVVRSTTQKSGADTILRAGAAIGVADNVDYADDILTALMLQSGTVMVDSKGSATFNRSVSSSEGMHTPGEAALEYYTSFADPAKTTYTWNRRLENSKNAFKNGSSAMYFGYAKDLIDIRQSNISFGVTALPQIKDRTQDPSYTDLNYASYWAGAVAKSSKNKNASWNFLGFAASRNATFKFLLNTGLPTARRDLIDLETKDQDLAVFTRQVLTADSWPQPDNTEIVKIFKTMIDDVILGRASEKEAIKKAAQEVTNLLNN